MNESSWLIYASIAVWLCLGVYLFLLGKKAARLETRLGRLEHTASKHARSTGTGTE